MLIKKLIDLEGSPEPEMAKACGYAGKASGRINLNQFRKAVALAREPIIYDFAITIIMSDGPDEFLGPKDSVCLVHPNIASLYPENPTAPLILTAYCRNDEPYPVVSFLLVKVPGSCPELVSDPDVLGEIGKVSFLGARSSMLSPKESGEMLANSFSTLSIASIQSLSASTVKLFASMLAGSLITNAKVSDEDFANSIQEALFHPAFHLFIPRGKDRRISSYRPCYSDIWERDDAGNSFIAKSKLQKLALADQVKSFECYTSHPTSGENVSVSGWKDIMNSLDDYSCASVGGMEQGDRTWWKILVEIK